MKEVVLDPVPQAQSDPPMGGIAKVHRARADRVRFQGDGVDQTILRRHIQHVAVPDELSRVPFPAAAGLPLLALTVTVAVELGHLVPPSGEITEKICFAVARGVAGERAEVGTVGSQRDSTVPWGVGTSSPSLPIE